MKSDSHGRETKSLLRHQRENPLKSERFWRGSNSRPSACKADVITTTPQNQTAMVVVKRSVCIMFINFSLVMMIYQLLRKLHSVSYGVSTVCFREIIAGILRL